MDDLISRSAAIQEINKIVNEYQGKPMIPSIFSAVAVIQNQPTAYNVDKVVEQINELRAYCNNTNCGDCKYKDTCFDAEMEKIIKAGGVND